MSSEPDTVIYTFKSQNNDPELQLKIEKNPKNSEYFIITLIVDSDIYTQFKIGHTQTNAYNNSENYDLNVFIPDIKRDNEKKNNEQKGIIFAGQSSKENEGIKLDLTKQKKTKDMRNKDELITFWLFVSTNIFLNTLITKDLLSLGGTLEYITIIENLNLVDFLGPGVLHGLTGLAGIASGWIGCRRAYNGIKKAKGRIDKDITKDLQTIANQILNILGNVHQDQDHVIYNLRQAFSKYYDNKEKECNETCSNIIGSLETKILISDAKLKYFGLQIFDILLHEKIYKADLYRNRVKLAVNFLGISFGAASITCTILLMISLATPTAPVSLYVLNHALLFKLFPFTVSGISLLLSITLAFSSNYKLNRVKEREEIVCMEKILANENNELKIYQKDIEERLKKRKEHANMRKHKLNKGLNEVFSKAAVLILVFLPCVHEIDKIPSFIMESFSVFFGLVIVFIKGWWLGQAKKGSTALVEGKEANQHYENFKDLFNGDCNGALAVEGVKGAFRIHKAFQELPNGKDMDTLHSTTIEEDNFPDGGAKCGVYYPIIGPLVDIGHKYVDKKPETIYTVIDRIPFANVKRSSISPLRNGLLPRLNNGRILAPHDNSIFALRQTAMLTVSSNSEPPPPQSSQSSSLSS